MTEGLAIELARLQMQEIGIGENYLMRYRHLRVTPHKKRTLRGENHFFYLLEPGSGLIIRSKAGIYNAADSGINEQQHVHRGIITLENTGEEISEVRFLQVVPKKSNTK